MITVANDFSVQVPDRASAIGQEDTTALFVRSAADAADSDDASNPYKGQASYTVEDAQVFFGREAESAELSSRILASRVTVLHAPSGAGKTSLLNARIVPSLESHGWFPVTSRPENDPVGAIRRNTLHTLFPPPETELLAFDEAVRSLELDERSTVSQLLETFDQNFEANPIQWRRLLLPVENGPATGARSIPFASAAGAMPEFARATPYFSRLLRRTIDVSTLSNHLAAISRTGSEISTQQGVVREEMPLGELRALLGSAGLSQSYRAMLGWFNEQPGRLFELLETICGTYGAEFPSFGIVLILDQFEEIFTRFAGTPSSARRMAQRTRREHEAPALDWKLRDELFLAIEELYRSTPLPGRTRNGTAAPVDARRSADGTTSILPIRYVVSLRDEYVGRLGPMRRFVADLDRRLYRLAWLPIKEAEKAVRKPAATLGYEFTDACVEQIIKGLAIEDAEIKPGPLQIVCRWVWKKRPADTRMIGIETLEPGGVEAIWSDFFHDYFQTNFTFTAKLAVLDLLSPLITSSGTRNIVERSKLVEVRFWNPNALDRLLQRLEQDRILRKERRLDAEFFEITHEFLIAPVLDALDRSPEYRRLDRALNALSRAAYERGEFFLDSEEFETLNDPDIKGALDWKPWMNELMLRAAIMHRRTDAVKAWANAYRQSPISLETLLFAEGPEGLRFLTSAELRELAREDRSFPVVYLSQIDRVFESLIASPEPLERELAQCMARRLKTHVNRIGRQNQR